MHSKGIIRAHGTHCGRFLRACLGAIRRALLGGHRFKREGQKKKGGGTKSEVAHKWVRWLHNPCRLGGPHRFRAGGQNQKWPTSGQGGYITPTAWGVPTTSEQGTESEVAAVRNGKSYFLGATQQSVDFRVGGQYQK